MTVTDPDHAPSHAPAPGTPEDPGDRTAAGGRSLWADAMTRLKRNKAAMTSLAVLAVIALACVFGPLISPHDPADQYNSYNKVGPSLTAYPRAEQVPDLVDRPLRRARADIADLRLDGDTLTLDLVADRPIDPRVTSAFDRTDDFRDATVLAVSDDGLRMTLTMEVNRYYFLLGTDANGRDLLTRILVGGRVSLMIGILATAVSLLIGVTYGAMAGYLGGRVDHLMMRVVDVLYSIPFMFFVILLMVFFGRNWVLMFIAVGAVEWLDMARIVRGQTLSVKRKEFIEAAHAIGVGLVTTVRRHVVP